MIHRPEFKIDIEIARSINFGEPVVALESAVITHGLPPPQNLGLAHDMQVAVRNEWAIPATVALLDGNIHVGLTDDELERLVRAAFPMKISRRDFAKALMQKATGGTTVSGTMFAAKEAGIKVFATGGIGGVHREYPCDISADLPALAETPMIVVCAGAKSILDLPATLEYLETMSVPVIGFGTNDFPAFYSRESGLKVSVKLDAEEKVAEFANTHWSLGSRSAVLVVNPVPEKDAISFGEMEGYIEKASMEAREREIHGQALTPFLLKRIGDLSRGKSTQCNIALLLNNAHLAARIARALSERNRIRPL